MRELFRMKIAAKRQMTAPQRLLDALNLSEGDEIQIEVADGQIVATHACKAVPTTLLSNELLSKIKKREAELVAGKGLTPEQAVPKVGETSARYRKLQIRLADIQRRQKEIVVKASPNPSVGELVRESERKLRKAAKAKEGAA